jgi:hypothetical protein
VFQFPLVVGLLTYWEFLAPDFLRRYWRKEDGRLPAAAVQQAEVKEKEKKTMGRNEERREIRRAVKQQAPPMGIYQLRCKRNGRVYVAASPNLEGERNSRLFQLRMGKVVFSPELQKDLDTFGPTAFEFAVLAELEPPEPGSDEKRALTILELEWLEKLQPFGERGYNSERKFRRDRERLGLP